MPTVSFLKSALEVPKPVEERDSFDFLKQILGEEERKQEAAAAQEFKEFQERARIEKPPSIDETQRSGDFLPRFVEDKAQARRAEDLQTGLNEFASLGVEAGHALQRGIQRTASDLILGTPEIAARTYIEVLKSVSPALARPGALESGGQLPLIARGVLESAARAGATAEQLGKLREAIQKKAEEEFPRSEELKNINLEELGLNILNPLNPEARRLFVALTAETAPQFASALGVGVAGRAAGLGLSGSAIAAGGTGGFQEAINTFDEAKRRGFSESEALDKFAQVFGSTVALDAIGFSFILGKLPKGVVGKLSNVAASAIAEGGTESIQEFIQGLVVGDSVKESLLQGLVAFGPGAFLGGGARAAIVAGDVDLSSRSEVAKLLGVKKRDLPEKFMQGKKSRQNREAFVGDLKRQVQAAEALKEPENVEAIQAREQELAVEAEAEAPTVPTPEPVTPATPTPEPEPTPEPTVPVIEPEPTTLKDDSGRIDFKAIDARIEELTPKTNRELNVIARELGLKGLSGLKKEIVIQRIMEAESAAQAVTEVTEVTEAVEPTEPVGDLKQQREAAIEEIDRAIGEIRSGEFDKKVEAEKKRLRGKSNTQLKKIIIASSSAQQHQLKGKSHKEHVDIAALSMQQISIQFGTGTIKVDATEKALGEAKKRIGRLDVSEKGKKITTSGPIEGPRPATPRPAPAAKKSPKLGVATLANVKKVLGRFIQSKPVPGSAQRGTEFTVSDGETATSTDGRHAIVVRGDFGGSKDSPLIIRADGKKRSKDDLSVEDIQKLHDDIRNKTIPSAKNRLDVFRELDTAETFLAVRRAMSLAKGQSPGLQIFRNPDGTIAFLNKVPEEGEIAVDLQEGAELITVVNADLLLDIVAAARSLGSETVDLALDKKGIVGSTLIRSHTLVVSGNNFDAVLAPIQPLKTSAARLDPSKTEGKFPIPQRVQQRRDRGTLSTLLLESPAIEPDPNTGIEFAPTYPPEMPMQTEQVLPPTQYMPMRDTPPPGWKRSTSAKKVFEAFEAILAAFADETGITVPIRTGRIFSRKAAGTFHISNFVIRLRNAFSMTTATHEIGHAVHSLMLEDKLTKSKAGKDIQRKRSEKSRAKGFEQDPLPPGAKKELVALGKNLYKSGPPPNGGYESEGIAEYIRVLLLDPGDAPSAAPIFHKWFHEKFLVRHPKAAKAFTKAQEAARIWEDEGAVNRAGANIVDQGSAAERLKRFREANSTRHIFERFFEGLSPIWDYVREIERITGEKLDFGDNPYFVGKALRGTHTMIVERWVEEHMFDASRQHTGGSLRDAVRLVRGKEKDFTIYLWANRAEAMWLDPKGARDPGMSLRDAQVIIEELRTPEFDLAAQAVYDWNDGVLNYAAGFSRVFAEQVRKIRKRDPGRYIPLSREFSILEERAKNVSRGTTVQQSGASLVKRLRGSGRAINNPFDTMIENATVTVRAAHNRFILEKVIALSESVPGMGKFIEEVKPRKEVKLVATVERLLDEIKRRAKKIGLEGDVPDLEGLAAVEIDEKLAKSLITFYGNAKVQREAAGEKVMTMTDEEGNIRVFVIDAELFGALDRLDSLHPDANGWMAKLVLDYFARPTKRIFTLGTTGLRPEFALIKNPFRDLGAFYTHTQSKANPAEALYSWSYAMTRGYVNAVSGKEDPMTKLWMDFGGSISNQLGVDRAVTRRFRKKLFQGKIIRTINPLNTLDMMRQLLQIPENASRVAEMTLLAKDLGYKPGDKIPLEIGLQLLLAGKEVTTDFSAQGADNMIRTMNSILPFMNANLQGPRASVRAAQRTPYTFWIRGLQLTAASIAIWWVNKDKEWYREMTPEERHLFTYWEFGDEAIRLPRPFEVGALFMALPEAMLNAWYEKDPAAVTEFIMIQAKAMNPVFAAFPIPAIPIIEESAEQYANRDFFFDTPIVSRALEGKKLEQQINPYTTQAAIFMGELFGMSPVRIDHAVRGIGGPVTGDILDILGMGSLGKDRKDFELSDMPVVGTLFRRGGKFGSRSRAINQLYDELDAANKEQKDTVDPETPEEKVRRLELTDAERAISEMRGIKLLTPQTERRRAIQKEMINIANNAIKGRRLQLNKNTEDFVHRQIRRLIEPRILKRSSTETVEEFKARNKLREANRKRAKKVLSSVDATSAELIALHRSITLKNRGPLGVQSDRFQKDISRIRGLESK